LDIIIASEAKASESFMAASMLEVRMGNRQLDERKDRFV